MVVANQFNAGRNKSGEKQNLLSARGGHGPARSHVYRQWLARGTCAGAAWTRFLTRVSSMACPGFIIYCSKISSIVYVFHRLATTGFIIFEINFIIHLCKFLAKVKQFITKRVFISRGQNKIKIIFFVMFIFPRITSPSENFLNKSLICHWWPNVAGIFLSRR